MGTEADEKRRAQAEQYRQENTYAAYEVGYHAKRHCTDLLGILLYVVAFGVMMLVAVVSFSNGDPRRLLYGVDRQGYLCGQDFKGNVPPEFNLTANGTSLAWTDMNVIVFPLPALDTCGERLIAPSGPTCEDLVADTMKLGVCWHRCPEAGEHISWYDGTDEVDGVKVGFDVLFDTQRQLNRCMPKESGVLVDNIGELLGGLGSINAEFAELEHSWDVITITLIGTIVFSFFWLFLLRFAVKPLVYLSMLLLFLVTAFVVYITFSNWDRSSGGTIKTVWCVLFFASAIWALVYVCLIVFFCKNVAIACDCIEEASKIPGSIPTMMAIPPVVVLCILPVAAFHILVWVYLYTSGTVDMEKVEQYTNVTDPTGVVVEGINEVTIHAVQHPNYETYAHIFNLFMFLWSMNFWISAGYMTVAFCGVFWYWSGPGDNKSPPAGVLTAMWWTARYHLGTLFLGSLLVAIVQLIRFLMTQVEDKLRKAGDHATVRCIIACIHCCLACLERLIKFVNNNAYIMTCMCSDNFCSAARRAIYVLLRNAMSVMLVNVISGWVMLLSKLMICAGAVVVGWALVEKADLDGADKSVENSILLFVLLFLCAYVIASVFINVFATCIDVVVLSFCYDMDVNDGMMKPYYLPSDLQRVLKVSNSDAPRERGGSRPPNFGGDLPEIQKATNSYSRF
eukprot:TRINITY_DN2472_c0_g1_i1.p1 TRINITY_DN2472_c0_g1~~TRINITY_DN2472_c0_g1_i1.p1  ORF type:complete len:679 (+),score=180.73 TRINITY_DN2472_c0_g1_i1:39-2075(+)